MSPPPLPLPSNSNSNSNSNSTAVQASVSLCRKRTCGPRSAAPAHGTGSTTARVISERNQWRRLQMALFLLTIPGLAMGHIRIDTMNTETTTKTKTTTDTSLHTTLQSPDTSDSDSYSYSYSPLRKIVFGENLNKGTPTIQKPSSGAFLLLDTEEEEDEFAWMMNDDGNAGENLDGNESEHESEHDNHRHLKSSSDSKDSRDEENFWKQAWKEGWGNSANYDKYINGDDDWSIYIGDVPPPTLLPLSTNDMFGFMLASLGATLGSLGGIGGGGLVVPCYVVVTKLDLKQAIPLGSVTVLGGSIAALILNLRRRHPLADRPIIDWDLILVMEPLVLVGTIFGSIFHRVISGKVLSVLLVFLLSIVAHTTLTKARRMYDAEKRYIEHLKSARTDYLSRVASFRTAFRMSEAAWSADALHGGGMDPESKASYMPPSPVRTQSLDSQSIITGPVSPKMDADERQRILILNPDFVTLRSDMLEQEKFTPRGKVLALIAKFSVLMFLNITLGGGAFRSPWGIQCGGVAFWVVHIIMIAFLISSAWAAQTYLVNRHELKEIIRFDYVHGDIKWDQRKAIVYPCFFILAGIFAGMFGIGGGMITVPLMLAMGVHPAICTSTSSTMVLFTVMLSSSSYAVFNLILWDYAVVCFCIGFIGSYIGNGIMQKARQTNTGAANFERNSFIAYCTGSVIMLCAFCMTLQYIIQTVFFHDVVSDSEVGLCAGYRIN